MLNLLWIGDDQDPAFAPTAAALDRCARLRRVIDASAAQDYRGETAFDLIVLAAPLPGDLNESQLVALRRTFPTAALVRIAGPWCGGEGRSNPAPAGITTYSWSHAAAALTADLERLTGGECPTFAEAPTAGEEERLMAATAALFRREKGRETPKPQSVGVAAMIPVAVSVVAAHPATRRWLCQACAALGYDVAVSADETRSDASIVVIDGGDLPTTLDWVSRRSRQGDSARLIAVVGFARPEDLEGLRAAGAAEVLVKPYPLELPAAALAL